MFAGRDPTLALDGEGREAGQWTMKSCHSPPANKVKGRHLVMLSRFLVLVRKIGLERAPIGCRAADAHRRRQLGSKQASARPGQRLHRVPAQQETGHRHSVKSVNWNHSLGCNPIGSERGGGKGGEGPPFSQCAPTIRAHLPRLRYPEPLGNACAMLVVCLSGQCWVLMALSDGEQ